MPRDLLSQKIFQLIYKSPKNKLKSAQSLRNKISQIHNENHGITMNAAASVYANSAHIKVNRYLSTEDRLSLQNLKIPTDINNKTSTQRKIHTIHSKPEFSTTFIDEANHNASTYPYVYILENTLRDVILCKFSTTTNWWSNTSIVNQDIQDYSFRIQKAESKYPWLNPRGIHPLYYVGIYECFKIIEKNWTSFKDVFNDLELLRTWVKEIVPIRNLIAHNVRIHQQDKQNVQIRTTYICTLVNKWKKSLPSSQSI
jgi:hypothetical protein